MPKVSAEYKDARRNHILQAAAACFAANGFHATSMQDVLSEAAISPGAFYRYFGSKADLIGALAEETATRLEDRIAGVLDSAAPGQLPIAALIRTVLSFEQQTGRGQIAVQLWSEALRDERIRAIVLDVVERIVKRLRAVAGDDDQARIIYAVLQGVTLQACWDPTVSLEALTRAASSLLDHRR
jgi:AcrR family transcriptional regulator